MKTLERDDILMAEFEGRKFIPYKGNTSKSIEFDNYSECLSAIIANDWEGFLPSLDWMVKPKYSTSMDWLMPIFDKIYNLGFSVQISYNECSIFWRGVEIDNEALLKASNDFTLIEASSDSTVKACYQAFVEFINWYNGFNKDTPLIK